MNQESNVVHLDAHVKQDSPRASRVEIARLLEQWQHSDLSLEAFAKLHGVPPQTLRYWRSRQTEAEDPQLAAFFESPAGVLFLDRFQLTVQLYFSLIGHCSQHVISEFLYACGMHPYLACSVGAQHSYGKTLEEAIVEFGQQQQQQLAKQMPPKRLTLAEDETFHPQICLVAMDPVSNYIVAEKYADKRDAQTWTVTVKGALEILNVEVIQVTSDAARGLIAHATKDLGVHHSPDLFHLQQDIGKAFFANLHAGVRQAESAIEEKRQEAAQWEAAQAKDQQKRAENKQKPGRPKDFQMRIDLCRSGAEAWEKIKEEREGRIEQATQQMHKLRDDYHPFNLETGASCKTENAKAKLTSDLDQLETMAKAWELPAHSHNRLAKVRRQLENLWQTIRWFWLTVGMMLKPFDLNPAQRLAAERLISYHYLTIVSEKTSSPEEQIRLKELAARLRQEALARDGPLGPCDAAWRERLDNTARECAQFFQRSSSCVEGRNGQLSLGHHGHHHLSDAKLAALTALHNFYLRRPDGTTAAERFFERPHEDLLDWLLNRMPLPSRGAARRPHRQHAASSLAA